MNPTPAAPPGGVVTTPPHAEAVDGHVVLDLVTSRVLTDLAAALRLQPEARQQFDVLVRGYVDGAASVAYLVGQPFVRAALRPPLTLDEAEQLADDLLGGVFDARARLGEQDRADDLGEQLAEQQRLARTEVDPRREP